MSVLKIFFIIKIIDHFIKILILIIPKIYIKIKTTFLKQHIVWNNYWPNDI